MKTTYQSALLALGGLLVGAAMAWTVSVTADGDPTTDDVPRMLPYQGTLELDGEPVHAVGGDAIAMTLALFDGASGAAPVYRQAVSVEVFAGRFTTTIGPVGLGAGGEEVAIADVVRAADDLYLGITLTGDPQTEEDDVTLTNRQRIHATPYAMWSTSATNLDVARDLVVGRDARVGGELTVEGDAEVQGLTVGADLEVTGASRVQGLEVSGLLNATGGLDARSSAVRVFGAWQDGLAFNTTHTAASDGIVVAFAYRNNSGQHVRMSAYSPVDALRVRSYMRVEAGDVSPSLTMPVRAGDTWRVDVSGTTNLARISFLPLGN